MNVSTFALAAAVFQQNGHRIISVNRLHPENYHLYYKKDGKMRVLSVPKKCTDAMKLQAEVQTLLSRNALEQAKLGNQDGSGPNNPN